MQILARVFLVVLLVTGFAVTSSRADGPGFGWWPLGEKESESPTPPPAAPPAKRTATNAASAQSAAKASATAPPAHATLNRSTTTAKPATSRPTATVSKVGPPAQPTQSPSTTVDTDETPWYLRSPLSYVDWSEIPKPPFLQDRFEEDQRRNKWVESNQLPDQSSTSPWQSVKDGAHRVGEGTRAAWHKTVDVLTPGGAKPAQRQSSSRVARRDTEPSFWSRFVPGQQQKAPEGPRTVTEWMGQERLKP
jgi:hypothetical protein